MQTTRQFPFSAVAHAARTALQWRLMLLWVLAMLIPTAIAGLPMWSLLASQLDYSVRAADIARQMDMTVLTDLLGAVGKSTLAINSSALLALTVTLLMSPLLSAMAASAARAGAVLDFRGLAAAAIADYPRMFRMLLWSAVPLGVAASIGAAAMHAAAEHGKTVIVEADAELWKMLAVAAAALVFACAQASLDAGRAALAIDRRRSSALKAWWSGCQLLIRRPLAGFGAYAVISAVGLALTSALVVGRINVAGANAAGFIAALLLVQLGVAVIGWMRTARLFALVELARCERG
jgi:hypothetical protein